MNEPLQRRAGRNNAARPSPFGITTARHESRVRRVTGSPFVLVERTEDDPPIGLILGLPITFGTLVNRSGGAIDYQVTLVDAAGRRMVAVFPTTIGVGADVPLLPELFGGTLPIWILAPGERLELEITAGNPNAGSGLWFWPAKQILESTVYTPRIPLIAGNDTVVMEAQPGHVLYPSAFAFNGDFRAQFLFNYGSVPVSAAVTIDTEEGTLPFETVVAAPNSVTPILASLAQGWGLTFPNRVRVQTDITPPDGDVVFEASILEMDQF